MVSLPTWLNSRALAWVITDKPTHLRRWGSEIRYALPEASNGSIIGAGDGCWLQLQDEHGGVSRRHASLACIHGQWVVTDLRSTNGTFEDDARRDAFYLESGTELRLGNIKLVAESPRLLAFGDFLARLLGWSKHQRHSIDRALYTLRVAGRRSKLILLTGDGDLVSVAHLLHRQTLGPERPFVVCDSRHKPSPTVPASGVEALAAAEGGTVCLWQNRKPVDFDRMVSVYESSNWYAQVIVCSNSRRPNHSLTGSTIEIPPLSERADEFSRIANGYASDAGMPLGESLTYAEVDRLWARESASHADLAQATHRMVLIHKLGVTRAAGMLGISHGALSTWYNRRSR